MAEKPSTIRPTDDDARRLACRLARGARFGAIGVIDPATGYPFTSRVLLATDIDGMPVMIGSALSTHTKALMQDTRCSLLMGEPGKGDPLAWPRLTLLADADRITRNDESYNRLRRRFLSRHPKSGLYFDFPDFSVFKLHIASGNLNGGFGRAYRLDASDLLIDSPLNAVVKENETDLIRDLERMMPDIADLLANRFFTEKTTKWKISGLDAAGLDLSRQDRLLRFEPAAIATSSAGMHDVYSRILK